MTYSNICVIKVLFNDLLFKQHVFNLYTWYLTFIHRITACYMYKRIRKQAKNDLIN